MNKNNFLGKRLIILLSLFLFSFKGVENINFNEDISIIFTSNSFLTDADIRDLGLKIINFKNISGSKLLYGKLYTYSAIFPSKEAAKESILTLKEYNLCQQVEYDMSIEMPINNNAIFLKTSNDPYNDEWFLNELNISQIQSKYGYGSPQVLVGIIDSGIDETHKEFNNKFNRELSKTFSGPYALEDTFGHGTQVAGFISAEPNNNLGISGIAPDTNVCSLKIDWDINTALSQIISAINYANSIGIDIINFSGGLHTYSSILESTIANYEGLFVTVAGSFTPINPGGDIYYPAAYDLDNILCVGAYNSNGQVVYNYGKEHVDLFAPGYNLYTTTLNNSFTYVSGTSFATPIVAACAALILAEEPNLTPVEIKEIILKNVNKNDKFKDKCVSGGALNIMNALDNL